MAQFSLLIIGDGLTDENVNNIVEHGLEDITIYDKNSLLYKSLIVAKENGSESLFSMNVRHKYDYIDIADILFQNNFDYIVFSDLKMSDFFYDGANDNKVTYYSSFLVGAVTGYNDSSLVFSDKHSALYEHIDDYLIDMKLIVANVKKDIDGRAKANSLYFIANNMLDNFMAHTLFATLMCVTELKAYPKCDTPYEMVFDMDGFDVGNNELIYFKTNLLTGTTIENMVNFNRGINPCKLANVDRIIKFIKKVVDFSEFKGRQYSGYQKICIERKIVTVLEMLKDYAIKDYQIGTTEVVSEGAGTVTVTVVFAILPIYCTEKCTLKIEVEL